MMRYVLDPAQGRFTVQAFARGALATFGHSPTFAVRDFTGELRFNDETFAQASFRLTVKADSLALIDPVSPKDREEIESRMRQEVLETAAYPEIVFEGHEIAAAKIAENWYRLVLTGKLRLRGVANSHPVDTQLRGLEDQVRLSGESKLAQSAYRIKRVSALGGLITLQDELKVAWDIVGRKQDE